MDRTPARWLTTWLDTPGRLPLVLRGARQVGKTWLVRDLAARRGLDLVECNLERDPALARALLASSSPRRILDDLGLALSREVREEGTLLFIDEIQARGEVLATLRWFAESMPKLPVVAAGSLLEFALEDHAFSMPVGRITYLHMGPLTYREFLGAHRQDRLLARLDEWSPGGEAPGAVVHAEAMRWWIRFLMTGGMPAVVAADSSGQDAGSVRRLQSDLAATYRDDFPKYARRTDPHVLDAVLRSVVRQLGHKFVYSNAVEETRHTVVRTALELLARARLCHLVPHSAANGLPLAGETNDRLRKALLADVGLVHALLGTPAAPADSVWDHASPSVRGQISEQSVGQELLALRERWAEPSLHYWQRGGGRPGEIDYLLETQGSIVPLETKSGASGSMKSLHQFMHDKGLALAIRCDANPPSVLDVDVKTTVGDRARFRLVSLPPYLLSRIPDTVAALR